MQYRKLIITAGLLLTLHLQYAAEAGCIRIDASWNTAQEDQLTFLSDVVGQGSSSGPAEEPMETPEPDRLQAKAALLSPSTNLMGGGASVPIEEQSGGGASSWASLDPPQCCTVPQVSRLRMDRPRWHPPPFSTGVFRPPRA